MQCADPAPHTFIRVTCDQRPDPASRVREDDQLLTLLVTAWALTTGRVPPTGPADQLTVDELITFWADDQTIAGDSPARF
ncbi:hypothetical protein [Nonomuraea cavernae]|uniref:hypothetical protein n=1 Tax=Nonomuraea cavernae TaxID=2045107 RepID=UPI0033C59A63